MKEGASQCLVLIRGWGFTEWQIWHEGCCPSKVMWSGDDCTIYILLFKSYQSLLQWVCGQQVSHISSATSWLWGKGLIINMYNMTVLFWFIGHVSHSNIFCLKVDAINSVQFSNHTGYAKGVRGQVNYPQENKQQLCPLCRRLQMILFRF